MESSKTITAIVVIIIVIIVAIIIYNFMVASPTPTSTTTESTTTAVLPSGTLPPEATTTSSASSNNTAKTTNVKIVDFAFQPATITINKGDTVMWTNNGSVQHKIASDDLSDLSSSKLATGDTYNYVFNQAGTFNYYCSIHTSMTGKVIVK